MGASARSMKDGSILLGEADDSFAGHTARKNVFGGERLNNARGVAYESTCSRYSTVRYMPLANRG
jgi:hypothetical protein